MQCTVPQSLEQHFKALFMPELWTKAGKSVQCSALNELVPMCMSLDKQACPDSRQVRPLHPIPVIDNDAILLAAPFITFIMLLSGLFLTFLFHCLSMFFMFAVITMAIQALKY